MAVVTNSIEQVNLEHLAVDEPLDLAKPKSSSMIFQSPINYAGLLNGTLALHNQHLSTLASNQTAFLNQFNQSNNSCATSSVGYLCSPEKHSINLLSNAPAAMLALNNPIETCLGNFISTESLLARVPSLSFLPTLPTHTNGHFDAPSVPKVIIPNSNTDLSTIALDSSYLVAWLHGVQAAVNSILVPRLLAEQQVIAVATATAVANAKLANELLVTESNAKSGPTVTRVISLASEEETLPVNNSETFHKLQKSSSDLINGAASSNSLVSTKSSPLVLSVPVQDCESLPVLTGQLCSPLKPLNLISEIAIDGISESSICKLDPDQPSLVPINLITQSSSPLQYNDSSPNHSPTIEQISQNNVCLFLSPENALPLLDSALCSSESFIEDSHCQDSSLDRAYRPAQKRRVPEVRRARANARERNRVHTISSAFEALRHSVPTFTASQKLSKLAVLRIASCYIETLAACLEETNKSDDPAIPRLRPSMSFEDCARRLAHTINQEGRMKH